MALAKPSCPPKTHVVPKWACSLGMRLKKLLGLKLVFGMLFFKM